MKKSQVYTHPFGSAEFVLVHAKWRASRNRRPSMPFNGERNPEKALEMATVFMVEMIKGDVENIVNNTVELINLILTNDNIDDRFEVMIGLKNHSFHNDFISAYKCFYTEIVNVIKQGTSHQWLETSNFIIHTVKTLHGPEKCVLNFFQAKELAYLAGIMENGRLCEQKNDISNILIDLFFLESESKNREQQIADMEEFKKAKEAYEKNI